MNRVGKASAVAITAAALMLVGVGSAYADDASFIKAIRDNGIVTGLMDDSTTIGLGHMMCSSLRDGSSLDTVAGYPRGWVDGHGIAVTAQHELCPDTLGAPGSKTQP